MRREKPFRPNDRDLEIIQLVYDYRYMSIELLAAMLLKPPAEGRKYGFTLTALRARCQKLREHDYLVWQFLRDQPSGRGYRTERPMVYSIGRAAIDVLSERTGLSSRQLKASIEKNEVTSFFLRHQLGISKFHTCLELACERSSGTVRLGTWLQDGLNDRVRVDVDGQEQAIPVVPDAVFSLIHRKPNGRTTLSHFALEFDMATMPQSRIALKARGHWHYIEEGLHRRKYTYAGESADHPQLRVVAEKWDQISPAKQEVIVAHGMRTLQVLFVTRAVRKDVEKVKFGKPPDRARQMNMIETVRLVPEIPESTKRFLFCTEDLDYGLERPVALFSPIWQIVNPGGGKLAILPDLD